MSVTFQATQKRSEAEIFILPRISCGDITSKSKQTFLSSYIEGSPQSQLTELSKKKKCELWKKKTFISKDYSFHISTSLWSYYVSSQHLACLLKSKEYYFTLFESCSKNIKTRWLLTLWPVLSKLLYHIFMNFMESW